MLKTILLILSLAENGEIHASFADAEDMAACAERKALVSKVVTDAGIEIVEARCDQSDLKFSEYKRRARKGSERYSYQITLQGDGFTVEPDSAGSCQPKETDEMRVICATSAQKPLP